jgi:hypothetical protein
MNSKYIQTELIRGMTDEQLTHNIIRMDQEKIALGKALDQSVRALNELINRANENMYRLQTERSLRELNKKKKAKTKARTRTMPFSSGMEDDMLRNAGSWR